MFMFDAAHSVQAARQGQGRESFGDLAAAVSESNGGSVGPCLQARTTVRRLREAEAWVGQKPPTNKRHSVRVGAEVTHATAGITWHSPVSAHARRPCRGSRAIVRMRGAWGWERVKKAVEECKIWISFIHTKIIVESVGDSALTLATPV